jgi:ABC-type multidrug transport system ATPase subunit/predicted component of type VI protein secretion system
MARTSDSFHSSWVIGSAADCDVVVPHAIVSRRHCTLGMRGGEFWVEDLGSTNGTFVLGNRIPPGVATKIAQGSRVMLGNQVAMPWPKIEATEPMALPRTITIGRSPESDVRIDLPIVSWNHARVLVDGNNFMLEDVGSRNGTYIDRLDNRITRARLGPESDVYFGSYKVPASQLISGRKVEIGESAFDKVDFRSAVMVMGRDPGCDVPLSYPTVSWHHVRLTRVAEGIFVEDLNSRNGTFVRGARISGKVLAKPGDEIALGSFRFQILQGGELERREYHGNVTIEAENVVVNARDRTRLVEPVSLTVFPSELVAVMGGSGAGKTTLLKALNGYTRPAEGRVLFNGADLYRFYDRFRQQMGYVPQDDIVHPQLTVGEALYFSARLRTDLSESEIHARVHKVLADLRIEDTFNKKIGSAENKVLSGGQRKRVNIGLELINDTPVLFLDEPTSGLSSYDSESLVELLKELSRQGKTVITTIHQPSQKIYKQFDNLIMLNKDADEKVNGKVLQRKPGRMVYFGPAFPDSIRFFTSGKSDAPGTSGASDASELSPDTMLEKLPTKSSLEWRELYRKSRYAEEFVEGRSGKVPSTKDVAEAEEAKKHFDFRQWIALVKRNVLVKKADKTQTAILLAQAPLFAVLIFLVYQPLSASTGFEDLSPKLAGVHFLLVVAAIWFGCNNAARDIVGEWTVYRRERMVTLKLGPYVLSKLAVLFCLCVVQCVSLLAIVYFSLHLKSNFWMDLAVLVLSALIGSGLGLCISAFSRTTESAIALLPVVLLPIIALGGGMRPVYQIDDRVRWVTAAIPSRWAFEANLLQETGCDGWVVKAGRPARDDLPDMTDPAQKQEYADRQRAAAQAIAAPVAVKGKVPATVPPRVDQPIAAPAGSGPCKSTGPKPILDGDVAELSIPRFVVSWKNDAGDRVSSRANEGETIGTVRAQGFRNPLRTSLIVLGSMLLALMVAALGILRKRDGDLQ